MTQPYTNRLSAIRQMLISPSQETVKDGYDLLFNLWLENLDSFEFSHDLIPIAVEQMNLIQEIKNRLEILSLKGSVTDTYLKKQLDLFASEVLKRNSDIPAKNKKAYIPISTSEKQKKGFSWWQLVLFGIITITILLVIYLPDLYQKILVIFVGIASTIALRYIFPRKDLAILIDSIGIKINYSFPTYLSIGDENIAQISIENSGKTDFNGRITLVFDDPGSFVTPAPDQNLSAKVEVSSLGRESKQIKFLVLKKPSDKNLNYHFVISSDKEQYLSNKEILLIAPIPYLRSTSTWLASTLGIVIVALLWDQLKKLLGF